MKAQAPRGTQDVLPAEQPYWDIVRSTAGAIAQSYGYQRIDTPIFEDTGVFQRGVGEGTDIVEKEMYTFEDKGGASLTLRAEGTAPVVRAYLEHGMFKWPQPVKLFYICPIFRFERPQAGRYRQHHQFGVEALGEMDPALDAEVIELLWTLYRQLELTGLSIQVNSIGDGNCRPAYLAHLKDYYAKHLHEVCDDDRVRFEKNPLRLLDCKVPSCQPIADRAPHSADYLCAECGEHFQRLRHDLKVRGLDCNVNFRLVRGLDYYTRTVFEIWPAHGGSTSTIGGGGRYDGLAEQLGGRSTPGVGFGTGIERIILNYKHAHPEGLLPPAPCVFVVVVGPEQRDAATKLVGELRAGGLEVAHAYGRRSLGAQLKAADASRARYAVILGPDELAENSVTLRALTGQEGDKQRRVPLDALVRELRGPGSR
ncbi:MAG: histidine--tRNA ligase [Chloroflexota bacterium]|nr:histidine--tRNA ligase [Chloroflexota bacterium]